MEKISVSLGNNKMGSIPNISLPPGASCVEGVPCLTNGCYAMRLYNQYPNVRNAWDRNLRIWNERPSDYYEQLLAWLTLNTPRYFRFHVGGDIPDQMYANVICLVARFNPDVKFLAFTKRFGVKFPGATSNLAIIHSMWPGLEEPEDRPGIVKAWLREDPRAPLDKSHVVCANNCGECGKKCWEINQTQLPIIFNKH